MQRICKAAVIYFTRLAVAQDSNSKLTKLTSNLKLIDIIAGALINKLTTSN